MYGALRTIGLLWWVAACLTVLLIGAIVYFELRDGHYRHAVEVVAVNIVAGWYGWKLGNMK